jgi:hypothetical protein
VRLSDVVRVANSEHLYCKVLRMPTPQRDAGASTGPCVECAPCGFHARHSSRELGPVTQTPCPEDRVRLEPHTRENRESGRTLRNVPLPG